MSWIKVRIGKSQQDQQIAAWIDRLQADGVNVSRAIKDVLYSHLTGPSEMEKLSERVSELAAVIQNKRG